MKKIAKNSKRLAASQNTLVQGIIYSAVGCGACGIYESATMKRYGW